MAELSNREHERLWRICQELLSRAGARAAMLCHAASGAVLVSVGDASLQGEPSGTYQLSERERIVRGPLGHIYGVDVQGGMLLAVLHDADRLEEVRSAAADAIRQISAQPTARRSRRKRRAKGARKRAKATGKKKRGAGAKKRRRPR